ncbi:hypothetical protein [Acinetobacter sp. NIPH 2699]|uniref:hypothetical protein n=1 Tax=Acinetobacter sp. NIPH 2699 TaxID=2923433 RepID=UPI001F4B3DA4|nr:hypothetical protein [Acinetobacter sp. NIPH 2699]MCH7335514.1 hypothetical protein [Acinetobacter sp. NIPH 2699]
MQNKNNLLAIISLSSFSMGIYAQQLQSLAQQLNIDEITDARCIATLYSSQQHRLGIIADGHQLFLSLPNSGLLKFSNIEYGIQPELVFINTQPEFIYEVKLMNFQRSSNSYTASLYLYRKNLGKMAQLQLKQSVIFSENCSKGKFGSVFYQRSSFSKLTQFLFFRH